MKKILLLMGLSSLILSACGKANTDSSSSSSTSTSELPSALSALEEKKDPTVETLHYLANAERQVINPTPPADESQKGHKIYAANNGVAETNEAGEIKENFRYYDLPANWTLNTENTEDETVAAVYDVTDGLSRFMVQLYNLNAFNKSPLEEGRNMTPEELEVRMTETNHVFSEKTTATIEGQEWQVGQALMVEQKMARITFYRMESTGAYDDSVVVGSIYYPLDSEGDLKRESLSTAIGQLKDVLYQISKK